MTPPPSIINPGATATFVIKFSANTIGPFNGQLSLNTNDQDEQTFNFYINGRVYGPIIQVLLNNTLVNNNDVITFGGTLVNSPKVKEFTLKNIGDTVLNNIQLSLPAGFSLISSLPSSLAPNASTVVQIKLDAVIEGPYNGLLKINSSNSSDNGTQFFINGSVFGSGLKVLQESSNIADNTGIFSFGGTTIGNPVVKSFTIMNTSNSSITLGNVNVPSGFIVLVQPPIILAANSSALFTVRLEASLPGPFNGDLSFTTTNPYIRIFNFKINGFVYHPEIQIFNGSTELTNITSIVTFGGTALGQHVIKTFTIKNIGDTSLNLGSLILPNGFAVETPPPTVINPGSSVTFNIKLTAELSGAYNGQLIIPNNDQDESPFKFYINGTVY